MAKRGRPFNPNKIPKKIISFNLDESLVHEFNEMCERESRNRSKVANNLFRDFMGKQKSR